MCQEKKSEEDSPDLPQNRDQPSNYRPIKCLPMMWKILTAQIEEEIYYTLKYHRLRKNKKILYTDKHILKETKTRQKSVGMVWIDYYDMVTQT